jgi:hypothetical protein
MSFLDGCALQGRPFSVTVTLVTIPVTATGAARHEGYAWHLIDANVADKVIFLAK